MSSMSCHFSGKYNVLIPTCRQMNPGPATKDTVRKAYEFALTHIGHDKESSPIWMEYIQFLKQGDVRSISI